MACVDDNRSRRKIGRRRLVGDFPSFVIDPLRMKDGIDLVDGGPLVKSVFGIAAEPMGFETHGILATAFETGAMPRRERSGLIQKEQLRPTVRCHDRSPPSFEFEHTGYPGLQSKRPQDLLPFIVYHTAIAHQGAPCRGLNDVPVGVHPILQHINLFKSMPAHHIRVDLRYIAAARQPGGQFKIVQDI